MMEKDLTDGILSLGPDSVVYTDYTSVSKCYMPADHPKSKDEHKLRFGRDKRYRARVLSLQERTQHAYLEAAILEALTDSGYTPKFRDFDEDTLTISMEHMGFPTVQEAKKVGLNAIKAAHYMARGLAEFHSYANKSITTLEDAGRVAAKKYKAKFGGKKDTLFRKRTPQQEIASWRGKILDSVFRYSLTLADYWNKKRLNPEELSPGEIEDHLERFIHKQEVNLNSFADKLIRRDREISAGERTLVLGEFKDDDLFYNPDGNPIFFDFPRVRRGAGSLFDSAGLLYTTDKNHFNPNIENASLNAVMGEYFPSLDTSEDSTSYRLRLIGKRVPNLVRALANFARKNDFEIETLARKTGSRLTPNQYLVSRVVAAQDLLKYYSEVGSGWKQVKGADDDLENIVQKQVSSVLETYGRLGIFL